MRCLTTGLYIPFPWTWLFRISILPTRADSFSFLLYLKVWGCKTWKFCHCFVLLPLKASERGHSTASKTERLTLTSCLLKSRMPQVSSHGYFVRIYWSWFGWLSSHNSNNYDRCSSVQLLFLFFPPWASSKKYTSRCHHDVQVVVISHKGFLLHVALTPAFYSPLSLF